MGCGSQETEEYENEDESRHLAKKNLVECFYYIDKSAAKDALQEFFSQSQGSTQIKLDDAVLAFRELSITTSEEELQRLLGLIGHEGQQFLTCADFLRVLISKNNDNQEDCENCAIFLGADGEFSGKIPGTQFEQIVRKLGYSGDDVEKDIQEQKGRDVLYYNEFKQLMQNYK